MTEPEQARRIAERILDKPYEDPDGDTSVLARQYNRALEREWMLRDALAVAVEDVCAFCPHTWPGEAEKHSEKCAKIRALLAANPAAEAIDGVIKSVGATLMGGW